MRVPTASSASGRQPASVRNGWAAVVRTTRPSRVVTSKTGLPAVIDEGRRRGHLEAARCGRGPRPAPSRRPSLGGAGLGRVTSSPVAGSSTRVSAATHLPIDGRAPTTFSVEGCRPVSSSSRSVKPVGVPVTAMPFS